MDSCVKVELNLRALMYGGHIKSYSFFAQFWEIFDLKNATL